MNLVSKVLITTCLLGCGAGTSQTPAINLADLPTDLTLSVGESRTVGTASIQFDGVKSDSRCPGDVQCVWAGNAEIELTVGPTAGEGPAQRLLLNTGIEPRSGTALGLKVTVVELNPAPVSTRPTKDYQVLLRLEQGQ